MSVTATESFRRSLIYSLQESFRKPLTVLELEDRLQKETFFCSAPLEELGSLKIPKKDVRLLVGLRIHSETSFDEDWYRVYFDLFYLGLNRIDMRAVYEAHC